MTNLCERIAVICSSNMNRSMEAHRLLEKKGYNISSYGTGTRVKLPGTSHDNPNVYAFSTPYNEIYEDLYRKVNNSGINLGNAFRIEMFTARTEC